jgi:hypothetical protein
MRWEDERYVKVYVRDTPEFLAMSWQARCLLHELVRKVDRAGILKVGKLGMEGIALALRAPLAEIESPIRELLEEKRLEWNKDQGTFLIPNHIEAQTTPQTDASRKRRERHFAQPRNGTSSDPPTEVSRAVTRGHIASPVDRIDRIEEPDESRLTRARLTPIDPERVLSSEGRAYAESVGVTDVHSVHRDFVNFNVSEAKVSANWEAMWRRWCDRELRIQRRERDRSRGVRAPVQQDKPGEAKGWEMPPIVHLRREKSS